MRSKLLNILFWSVISAAFIGPGTITTAAKAGADFGLPLLWALTFSTIACLVLQEASARLSIVSGLNLGQAIATGSGSGRAGFLFTILTAICILTGTAAYQAGNLMGAMSGISLFVDIPSWIFVLVIGLLSGIILFIPSLQLIARIMGALVAIMGISFLAAAILLKPPISGVIHGMIHPIIPLNPGGGILVLGLIGTTVVPYNLFLGSGISKGNSLREMRSGLSIAILIGGAISMAVLVTGTALSGEFSYENLAISLSKQLGGVGFILLGGGLFAAGFTSSVTAPLASAITVRSLFGGKDNTRWLPGSLRFRLSWAVILLTGMVLGMAGFKPVPVIVLAQALNGLILPVISIILFVVINDRKLLSENINPLPANFLMAVIVFITLVIGGWNIMRSLVHVFPSLDSSPLLFVIDFCLATLILIFVLIRIYYIRARN